MRNRDPHRENVENILEICLPIVTMQHIREKCMEWWGVTIFNYAGPPKYVCNNKSI